ncbi:AAA family ATPase [Singulisphaera sp. Ch08]|uniref:AAA family ATPase n=1 Tax=Singulisphaera sp. Ch08 TaxID=3120278 RepID=A0AAU7CI50_9BACT
MRFLRLQLKAVGPFSGAELDLSGGQHGLHLIYGPNEAGKTSTLRALSHLLFGFPTRTADGFIHPYDQLRVGGTLSHSDGEVLEIVRRKGNKNTLRDLADAATVAPERLERFLGGVDQETFENLFGIDHARLKQAGEEIKTGQGRLGELLFAAGTGLAGLGQAKQRLQERLDALFKPRGQNQRINQALAEYRVSQDEIKRFQLPSEDWQRHDRALRDAQEQGNRLVEQTHAARRALNRMIRVRDAIPQVARLRRLQGEFEQLGDIVRLRDSFGSECREAQETLHLVVSTIEQTRTTVEELDARLAETEPRHRLLDSADAIEALKEQLGAVEKALEHRPRLENWRLENEHLAREILGKLGRSRDLDAAEELHLRADEPPMIRALGQRFTALRVQRDETRSAIAKHEEQAGRLEREQSALGTPRDVASLRRAVRAARKAGDLDARNAEARAAYDGATRQAALGLQQLPGWSGSLDDLERQAVPVEPTLVRFESDWQAVERELRLLDDQENAEAKAVKQLEAQLRALDLHQDVPTEDDLRAARQRRDEGWRLVRDAGPAPSADSVDAERGAFVAEFAPGRALADAFEQSMLRADAMGDRLRHEAERVARKAEWLAQLDAHQGTREGRSRTRRDVEDRRDRVRADWKRLVDALGVSAAEPAELRAWLRQRAEVVHRLEQARDARLAREDCEALLAEHRAAVERAMGGLSASLPDPQEGLAALLEQSEEVLEREDRASRRRETLINQIAEARADLARDQLRLQATEEELSSWRLDWSAKMARIGLEPDAAPEQAEIVLTEIQSLFEALSKRREFQSRIRGIDRDADQFAAAVATIRGQVGLDLQELSPAALARELAQRLREERDAEQRRTTLIQQRDRESQRLREAETEQVAVVARLDRLRLEAGCASTDELPEAERRSRDRARLEDDLRACEDQVIALGAGADLAQFSSEVEQADADDLGPAIAQREADVAALESELHAVKETLGAERVELARMDGGDSAAEAAEKAQTITARLQTDVILYAKLKLAAAVLNRGIEKYREKSQGPVLARASQLFADLTDGSFSRLQIDDDGDGRSLLKGVRADGRLVGVEGMSDGSHDQLYLALRLASLESWLQAHEPIPFVVDDILLNFDDRRALAALRALAELSRRTQVLFFTHHAHLFDLARKHLADDVVFIQTLPSSQTG